MAEIADLTPEEIAEAARAQLEDSHEALREHGLKLDLSATSYTADKPAIKPPRGSAAGVALRKLLRIQQAEKDLKAQREQIMIDLMPTFFEAGQPILVQNPYTGKPMVAGPRQSETLNVDLTRFRKEMRAHYKAQAEQAHAEGLRQSHLEDAQRQADEIVDGTLKDPAVDTKENGRFAEAVSLDLIPAHVLAACTWYSKSASYIGFSKPQGRAH